MLALVLVAVLLVTAATPARAEAMEPTTIMLIASTGIGIIILIAYLIAANVSDRNRVGVPAYGVPIGGTPVNGVFVEAIPVAGMPIGGVAVPVTSYVVAPVPAPPMVVAPAVEGQ
jgi:hypothetical protein